MKNITYKLKGSDKSDLNIFITNEDNVEGGLLVFEVVKGGENPHQIDFYVSLDELEGLEKFINDCKTHLSGRQEIAKQRDSKRPDEENLTLLSHNWWNKLPEESKQLLLNRFKYRAEEVQRAHLKFMYEIITNE